MRFDVITLFPEVFPGPVGIGVVGKALESGLVELQAHNLRDHAGNRHRQVDDMPYGGGPGMVLKPEPVYAAVREVRGSDAAPVVILTPTGTPLSHALAAELARAPRLVLLAGRYEGFDERISALADYQVSIGDYVLSGGELAAMVLIEAVARHVPGVLGHEESAGRDSFVEGMLEHPQYTRPPEFEGLRVPDVLLSGHHEEIRRWRERMSLERTRARRPELLQQLKGEKI
ncbi:MAG: tRNA (guanosine(37)-N1)-methyltransferase TrmD [Candidatus Dormibacteria bacterium]